MSHHPDQILVLAGPTGSGKTPLAIHLAKMLNGEIISADSRQIYKFMDIGTAKPSPGELAEVPHHFIDILTPDKDYNAGMFSEEGRAAVQKIIGRGKMPIVAGGSGLYIQALIDGFFDGPPADPEFRERYYSRYSAEGGEAMLEELRTVDPVAAAGMLPTNSRRIVRALEVFHLTGKPISEHQKNVDPIPYKSHFVALQWDRKELYHRIDARVNRMLEAGFLDEVKGLQEMGYMRELNALQTVGYKEAFQYLNNEKTYDEMVEWMKRNTRRYAKRQLTWFRPDTRIQWYPANESTDLEKTAEKIVEGVKRNN